MDQKTNVKETAFGDGYSHRIPEGINNLKEVHNLSWKNIPVATRDVFASFLAARLGVTPFSWTPPGESTPKAYKCSVWKSVYGQGTLVDFSATFEQVFEVVP